MVRCVRTQIFKISTCVAFDNRVMCLSKTKHNQMAYISNKFDFKVIVSTCIKAKQNFKLRYIAIYFYQKTFFSLYLLHFALKKSLFKEIFRFIIFAFH